MHDEENDYAHDESEQNLMTDTCKKAKPHIIRRHIEDYLEQKALKRRLQDVFDEGFDNDFGLE